MATLKHQLKQIYIYKTFKGTLHLNFKYKSIVNENYNICINMVLRYNLTIRYRNAYTDHLSKIGTPWFWSQTGSLDTVKQHSE